MVSRFIIIDNDAVNNLLCTLTIKDVAGKAEIKNFDTGLKAFDYIAREYSDAEIPTILLLDINMPIWSGWDFLDNFEKMDEKIKRQIKIYMISSSIDTNDKNRAKENKNVADYIEKPLSEEIALLMSEQG